MNSAQLPQAVTTCPPSPSPPLPTCQVKTRVMAATSWPDSAATHLATAMITGVVSTTATNPVDVIKTFMFVGQWPGRLNRQCVSGLPLDAQHCCLHLLQAAAPTATRWRVRRPSTTHTAWRVFGAAGWPTMLGWAHRQ